MSDITGKFEKLIKDLEKNLESQKDLEYVKKVLPKFFNEINQSLDNRLDILEESQRELEFKTNKIDEIIKKIENDLYIDEDENEDFEFEIVCPYCNYTFETELDELKTEIRCPECSNIIELDWNSSDIEDDGCIGNCSCCHGCNEEEFEDDIKNEDEEDDDM